MTGIQAIDRLMKQGTLCDTLLKVGALVPSKLTHAEIYRYYQGRIRHYRKLKDRRYRGKALEDTIKEHRVSKDTIYRIKKELT